jgi:hypothetical protein
MADDVPEPAQSSPAPAPARALTEFTPVPRLKDRSNGWKPEVQRAFIAALADYGSVAAACRVVGRADHGAYRLRRHPEGKEFAAAWDRALAHGVLRLQDSLMERAIHGVPVPVYSYGKLIGERRVYNDRLGMFMLRNRLPEAYCEGGARGLSAVDAHRMKRLKEAWRAEWLDEQRPRSLDEVRDSILTKLEAIERAERDRWTPRERELHEALDAERAARKEREQAERDERFRRDNRGKPWCEEPDDQAPPALLPPPPEETNDEPPEEPSGPRVRTLKDDGW